MYQATFCVLGPYWNRPINAVVTNELGVESLFVNCTACQGRYSRSRFALISDSLNHARLY